MNLRATKRLETQFPNLNLNKALGV
ncbi:hypothetical protein NITGR_290051 [Nitrospina gracilis 3/211]|uniref:Uncharacterized protein n=1 Tax=Nitrospina gracilis (strain 3/211) TaxID=1266370 RepID=M1YY71_NITG3|nr:hypothetical protein NITGR_290051 [Nitrospina gracilis 3/211]